MKILKATFLPQKTLRLKPEKDTTLQAKLWLGKVLGEPEYQPIFSAKEVAEIDKRIAATPDPKEAFRLKMVLEETASQNPSTYDKILQNAMLPKSEAKPFRITLLIRKRENIRQLFVTSEISEI